MMTLRPERAAALAGANVCDTMAFRVTASHADGLHCRLRWRAVLRRAQAGGGGGGHGRRAAGGGALAADFEPAALTACAVADLADIIDQELLDGQLRRLARPGLSFGVEDVGAPVRAGWGVLGGLALTETPGAQLLFNPHKKGLDK
jgi:hypothetical protein